MERIKNAFIIHGAFGTPQENWFPWLKNQLESMGLEVYVPQFPTPEGHTLGNWLKVFEDYIEFLNPESIMIGHSMGPAFILNVLEQILCTATQYSVFWLEYNRIVQ